MVAPLIVAATLGWVSAGTAEWLNRAGAELGPGDQPRIAVQAVMEAQASQILSADVLQKQIMDGLGACDLAPRILREGERTAGGALASVAGKQIEGQWVVFVSFAFSAHVPTKEWGWIPTVVYEKSGLVSGTSSSVAEGARAFFREVVGDFCSDYRHEKRRVEATPHAR